MELAELEAAWRSLDASVAELRAARRARRLAGVRWRLRWFSLGQWAQVLGGVVVAGLAGSTWTELLDRPELVACGLFLHGWGVALITGAAVQLAGVLRLDLERPVLEVQEALVRLRRTVVRWERGLLFAGFLAWGPASLLVLDQLGLDMLTLAPGGAVLHLLVSLAIALVVLALSLRFSAAFDRDAARALDRMQQELADLSAGGTEERPG